MSGRQRTRVATGRRRPTAAAGGYTLLEMVLSMAILGVILLGAQSAVLIASRALPQGEEVEDASAAARALDALSSELADAVAITEATDKAVRFTLPDRDGDGAADDVRYAFSGTALVRSLNGRANVTLVSKLKAGRLTYDTLPVELPGGEQEGAETLLASYDAAANLNDQDIDANHFIGQQVRPALPANAVGWSVTRVKFKARYKGARVGHSLVRVRPAIGLMPAPSVLAEATLAEQFLKSDHVWEEVALAGPTGLGPTDGVCLTIEWGSDSTPATIQYQGSNAAPADSTLVESGNGGSSWSAPTGRSLLFQLYGKVRTAGPPVPRYALRAVRCGLTTRDGGTFETVIWVRNRPLMP